MQNYADKYNKDSLKLYSAALFANADDYHKGRKCLAQYLCNKELKKQEVTKGMGSYSYLGTDDGFEVNGKKYVVENMEDGKVI